MGNVRAKHLELNSRQMNPNERSQVYVSNSITNCHVNRRW